MLIVCFIIMDGKKMIVMAMEREWTRNYDSYGFYLFDQMT